MSAVTPALLESMKLPPRLQGFIAVVGIDRRAFSNVQEWKQLCSMYEALCALKSQAGFAALAETFASYMRHYQQTHNRIKNELKPPVQTKQKQRRRNRQIRKANGGNLFPSEVTKQLAKPTPEELAKDRRQAQKIGLGLETSLKPPPKARRDDVVLDEHTAPVGTTDRYHALYTAGWSLNED
ncbi:hypothetical protein D9M69_487500 [compost metagenome]